MSSLMLSLSIDFTCSVQENLFLVQFYAIWVRVNLSRKRVPTVFTSLAGAQLNTGQVVLPKDATGISAKAPCSACAQQILQQL